MSDDLYSVQAMVVSALPGERSLFRSAAAAAQTPVEMIDAESAEAAARWLSAGVDLLLIDAALGEKSIAHTLAIAQGATKSPFTVLLAEPNNAAAAFPTDAIATKPAQFQEARRLLESVSRVRRTCRVMVLDDSSTMRRIVCKMLATMPFPLEITEVAQGGEAIELASEIEFDIAFVDYNLPGFNGLETIAEIRRLKRDPSFVLITSAHDESIATRARGQGAAFLTKPFFPADIEAVLCNWYGLRALNAKRRP